MAAAAAAGPASSSAPASPPLDRHSAAKKRGAALAAGGGQRPLAPRRSWAGREARACRRTGWCCAAAPAPGSHCRGTPRPGCPHPCLPVHAPADFAAAAALAFHLAEDWEGFIEQALCWQKQSRERERRTRRTTKERQAMYVMRQYLSRRWHGQLSASERQEHSGTVIPSPSGS